MLLDPWLPMDPMWFFFFFLTSIHITRWDEKETSISYLSEHVGSLLQLWALFPETSLKERRCWFLRALLTTLSFLPGLYGDPYSQCISSHRDLECLWVSFRTHYTCKSGAACVLFLTLFFSSTYTVLREIS